MLSALQVIKGVSVLLCFVCIQQQQRLEMININTKSDPRVSQNFPNDPYSNICIVTSTQKLNLQHAFLSMDSDYFSKIDPDTSQINFQQLKEQPLIKIIRSLYGEQLVASSISELVELYPIIVFLGIEDYKKNIEEEVSHRPDVLESIQFLDLSFRQNLCWDKVVETHLENKLRLLEHSKNYLQLSKISNDSFNFLMLSFIKRYGEAQSKVVNNVMQNYFNRKNIKPMVYLKNPALQQLQSIWLKYHHVQIAELTPKSSPVLANILTSTPNLHQFESVRPRKTTQAPRTSIQTQNVQGKRRRVIELEKQISHKDSIIEQLNLQIEQSKRLLGIKSELCKPATARSLLVEVQGERERGSKRTKRLQDLLGDNHSDNQSVVDGKQGVRNGGEGQMKGMHRLGSKNAKRI